jgi:hypothetical protein
VGTLERGKPTPSNIPERETIKCPDCEMPYTLAYTNEEYRVTGSESNVERMQRLAREIIAEEHPTHSTRLFMWKAIGDGPLCHWVEADSMAARAAL